MRTKEQEEANEVDLALFRVISRVSARKDQEPWRSAYWALMDARPHIRQAMHEDDRRETS